MTFNNVIGESKEDYLFEKAKPTDDSEFAKALAFNYDNMKLTYVKQVTGHQIKLGDVGDNPKWIITGYHRYNTYIVRYIEWFAHLQRAIRLMMRQNLTNVSDAIVHKQNALDERVTEYEGNNKFDMSAFD